jgi:hypothetical protein
MRWQHPQAPCWGVLVVADWLRGFCQHQCHLIDSWQSIRQPCSPFSTKWRWKPTACYYDLHGMLQYQSKYDILGYLLMILVVIRCDFLFIFFFRLFKVLCIFRFVVWLCIVRIYIHSLHVKAVMHLLNVANVSHLLFSYQWL